VKAALVVLALLVFSKYFYMASFTSYFTFYLIEKFDLSVASSQLHLFLFLGAVAAGTFFGGPISDKIGRKAVIWFSILGSAPFTLMLPYIKLSGYEGKIAPDFLIRIHLKYDQETYIDMWVGMV
ncbi:MFS transporter, partial [Pseudomonas viridiflava]|uniref:MFS transporter n=1 Tax=Pseudomonas viridiflava TaxID=33069 RepID=UPI001F13C9E5